MPLRSLLSNRRRVAVLSIVALGLALAIAAWLWPRGPRVAKVVEYAMAVATDIPTALAIAPDGSVWFSIDFSDAVGVVRAGKVERIPKGSRSTEPIGIAVDTAGRAWVTDAASVAVVSVQPNGAVQSVKLGTPIARLGRMAAAPDGAVWFAESTAYSITRLKDGELKRHSVDSVRGGPYGVAVTGDGTVWATMQSANSLPRSATSSSPLWFPRAGSPAAPRCRPCPEWHVRACAVAGALARRHVLDAPVVARQRAVRPRAIDLAVRYLPHESFNPAIRLITGLPAP